MNEIVIVAIPAEDDPVWKVSSEKVPHLTLLYMKGPLDNEENTIRYIQHVVDTSLCKFGMSVERRGTLGEDDADVLFFEKTHNFRKLLSFRSYLLSNNDISSAYRKAQQYPMWTPHLTLGYPATPAKPNPNDFGIGWITFDRIAVWTGDFEGPEFLLDNDYDLALDTVYQSEQLPALGKDMDSHTKDKESLDDFLMHFGVRGMKWGVRNKRDSSGSSNRSQTVTNKLQENSTKKTAKADSKFEKKFKKDSTSLRATVKIHNAAAEHMNKVEIPRINNKPAYKDQDFTRDTPLRRKYYKEFEDAFVEALENSAAEFGGTNASGTKKYGVIDNGNGTWNLVLRDVKHAEDSIGKINVSYDKKGHILSFSFDEDTLSQTAILSEDADLDEILMHYGVRGMKWGVRRKIGPDGLVISRAQNQANRAQDKANRAKATADRHKGRPFNGLEQRNAKSLQKVANRKQSYATARKKTGEGVKNYGQKVKANTPAARRKALDAKLSQLSTQEIQTLNNRIRATQEYRKLSAQEKLYNRSTPKRMADWLLGINQPQRKGGSSLKDKIEVAKVTNKLINDMLEAKAKKGG